MVSGEKYVRSGCSHPIPRLQGKEARLQSVKTEFARGFVDIVEELRCSGFDLGSTPW